MTYLLPPLNALRAFEAAARHLSFKEAAHELHGTAGAVSQQVRLLEERLGVQLFERLTRQIILTPVGEAYLTPVRQAFRRPRGQGRCSDRTQPAAPPWLPLGRSPAFLPPRQSTFRSATPSNAITPSSVALRRS
jgi:DNA-binding transcriptional LysR family regulator